MWVVRCKEFVMFIDPRVRINVCSSGATGTIGKADMLLVKEDFMQATEDKNAYANASSQARKDQNEIGILTNDDIKYDTLIQ
jgi:hypothetical protein